MSKNLKCGKSFKGWICIIEEFSFICVTIFPSVLALSDPSNPIKAIRYKSKNEQPVSTNTNYLLSNYSVTNYASKLNHNNDDNNAGNETNYIRSKNADDIIALASFYDHPNRT